MNSETSASGAIEFGRFTVHPLRRELLCDGEPIALGGRAFDVLMALIESRGTVLSKDDLIGRVWPDRVVEENNLQVQIAAVRRALSNDRDLVRTIAGRGYQFTGEVLATADVVVASSAATNLVEAVSELIGREANVGAVSELVTARRLVTLVGAGGIGKTRLSLEVARRLLPRYANGVWVVELAPLSDPELVPVTVGRALGLTLAAGTPSPERIAAALGTQQILLVLDNCEHVIEAAARMAEVLLRASASVSVLATSREPLRTPGEHIYRLQPLDVPDEATHDTEELLHAGAMKLFFARARAADPHFSPDQRVVAVAAAICRRLDGIPLAIELAAARAAALGVEALAARLDDRFRLLTGGHRTALPRHQTLRATLDWSYDLLSEFERTILNRLAVFAGGISLESAAAVAGGDDIDAADVVDCVTDLVAKSLVVADANRAGVLYRLLETTRAYALEKLKQRGELHSFSRRHADYQRGVFERAADEWKTRPVPDWLADYGRQIHNLRASLDWAFSAEGDTEIAIALTIAAVPLWIQMSLMDECRGRVERAIASLGAEASQGTQRSMQLYAALGLALMCTKVTVHETRAALSTALEIARTRDDTDYQLRALWGLCVDRVNNGAYREALTLAEEFSRIAIKSTDPVDLPIGERMIGLALHYLGDTTNSRVHFERMLEHYAAPTQRSHMIRFLLDQRGGARAIVAEILWLQGFPDQAMGLVEANISEEIAADHALSLCNSLAKACAVAMEAGDLEALGRFVATLLYHSSRHGVTIWHAWGCCFEGALRVKRGDVDAGLQVMRNAVDRLRQNGFAPRYPAFLGELAHALGEAGLVVEGLHAIDEAIERSERFEEHWCMAELLRIKGQLVLLHGAADSVAAAEAHFLRGLGWAQRQGALSWELRCATSLAMLWSKQGRDAQAREQLESVFNRFTEGFTTVDLQAAQSLLDALP